MCIAFTCLTNLYLGTVMICYVYLSLKHHLKGTLEANNMTTNDNLFLPYLFIYLFIYLFREALE